MSLKKFGHKVKRAFKKVYDATSSSKSSFGKHFGKYAYPHNAQYFIRDGWRSLKKHMAGQSSAANISATLPASYVPGTGFRRYV